MALISFLLVALLQGQPRPSATSARGGGLGKAARSCACCWRKGSSAGRFGESRKQAALSGRAAAAIHRCSCSRKSGRRSIVAALTWSHQGAGCHESESPHVAGRIVDGLLLRSQATGDRWQRIASIVELWRHESRSSANSRRPKLAIQVPCRPIWHPSACLLETAVRWLVGQALRE